MKEGVTSVTSKHLEATFDRCRFKPLQGLLRNEGTLQSGTFSFPIKRIYQIKKDLHILLVSPHDRIIFTTLIRLSLIHAPGSRTAR